VCRSCLLYCFCDILISLPELRLPPYVEILASHTRLSLYSSVINHPTAPVQVKHFFRAAGLASALNVMRAAVRGENQLKSMPNNTAIMISFAACFALGLSIAGNESRGGLAPSVILLINQTADVLERIGSTPAHRKGASALFAKQLRRILALSEKDTRPFSQNFVPEDTQPSVQIFNGHHQAPQRSSNFQGGQLDNSDGLPTLDRMNFLGMTNDEIFDAVNHAGIGLEMPWTDFQFDEGTNLEWLDWPS
jgi:hypothetical protein